MEDTGFAALPRDNLQGIQVIGKLLVSRFYSHLHLTPTFSWLYSILNVADIF